ncbi:hypothetical protein C8J56DRAFT_1050228 [Mycena floridula]|nr:hypothetical protein C8J56DRAFT_1050228 [Mycena floridula]
MLNLPSGPNTQDEALKKYKQYEVTPARCVGEDPDLSLDATHMRDLIREHVREKKREEMGSEYDSDEDENYGSDVTDEEDGGDDDTADYYDGEDYDWFP